MSHADFSKGKLHGTYYITQHGTTVALNFSTQKEAERWAKKFEINPYKIFKVESK